jgi:hypothetical protein
MDPPYRIYKYWTCPCGDPGVTHAELPFEHACPVCKRVFTVFDPEDE